MTAYVSAFDLFSIGIGPSSSHTVGPLRAAAAFAARLDDAGMLDRVDEVTCTLYGSLGSTGIGHGTPDAVIAGLRGLQPETCRPEDVRGAWSALAAGSLVFGFAFTLFEILVAILQAYVFTLLTAVYIQLAVAEEH